VVGCGCDRVLGWNLGGGSGCYAGGKVGLGCWLGGGVSVRGSNGVGYWTGMAEGG